MRGPESTYTPTWRSLTPTQATEIRRARAAGARAADLAVVYGVSVRTIYRTLRRDPQRFVRVEIEGYRADFEVGDLGPVQVTRWYAA